MAASREACELLRKMRPATVNSAAQQRDLAEREAVILDKMTELAQALFSYDSAASHTDPHLRDIAWPRENAETSCQDFDALPALKGGDSACTASCGTSGASCFTGNCQG